MLNKGFIYLHRHYIYIYIHAHTYGIKAEESLLGKMKSEDRTERTGEGLKEGRGRVKRGQGKD